MAEKNEEKSRSQRVLTIVGIVLCVILVPILIINIVLIIKSYTNPDDVPSLGGWSPLIVLSPSMEPNIKTGDLVFSKRIDPGEIKEDDVISFFDPDSNQNSVLTHRVIEVLENADGTRSFRTQGDANVNSPDPMAVQQDKVIGIYRFRIPGLGSVAMFMQTTAGLVVCVFVPLLLLVGWDIFRRKRYEAKNQQDTDALLAELEALKAQKAAEAVGEAPAVETEPEAEEPAGQKDENPTEEKEDSQ